MNSGEDNSELFIVLLNTALYDAKCRNGKAITFFCDDEDESS